MGHYHGKFKQGNSPLFWVRLGALVLVVVCAAAILVIRLRLQSEDADMQQLSRLVAEATVPSSEGPTLPTEGTTPPAETEPTMLFQYVPLYEQNPEVFGWVKIADTKLDYPVMHTPADKEKYLHLSFDGQEAFSGTPFLDARCDENSDNWILYGHNMPDGTMFRTIMGYETVTFWKAHPVIRMDTLYAQGEYEVMSAFYDRVYYEDETCFKFYNFIQAETEAEFNEAVANYKEKSIYDTGVTAHYGDRLLTLVTCASYTDEGRFVVVAREKKN